MKSTEPLSVEEQLLAIKIGTRGVVNGYDVFRSDARTWHVNVIPYTTLELIVARVSR